LLPRCRDWRRVVRDDTVGAGIEIDAEISLLVCCELLDWNTRPLNPEAGAERPITHLVGHAHRLDRTDTDPTFEPCDLDLVDAQLGRSGLTKYLGTAAKSQASDRSEND
jgi:hypothetical protein